ncbi:MAG: hypothetical protein K9I34_05285 [Bacteroidales bacterium]|nr:hypothetical protein [Bacteroidales bacterium]
MMQIIKNMDNRVLTKRLIFALLFLIGLASSYLLIFYSYYGLRISSEVKQTRESIINNKYELIRLESPEDIVSISSEEDRMITFDENYVKFFFGKLVITGRYKIEDEFTMEIYSCDTFKKVFENKYTLSVPSTGINLISGETVLIGKINTPNVLAP